MYLVSSVARVVLGRRRAPSCCWSFSQWWVRTLQVLLRRRGPPGWSRPSSRAGTVWATTSDPHDRRFLCHCLWYFAYVNVSRLIYSWIKQFYDLKHFLDHHKSFLNSIQISTAAQNQHLDQSSQWWTDMGCVFKKGFHCRGLVCLIAFPLIAVPSWKPLGMLRPCTTITPVALASSSSSTFPRTETFREAASLTVSFSSSLRFTFK